MQNRTAPKQKKPSSEAWFLAGLTAGLVVVCMAAIGFCLHTIRQRFPYFFGYKPADIPTGPFILMFPAEFALIGACIFIPAAGAVYLYGTHRAKGCHVRVTARILSVREAVTYHWRRRRVTWLPTYGYVLNGRTVQVEAWMGDPDPRAYWIGRPQEMLVNPDDPRRYLIEGDTPRRATVLLRLGLILLAVGIVCFLPALALCP